MLNEMSPYILLGFLIAGLIYAVVPQELFVRHLSSGGWKAVVKAAATREDVAVDVNIDSTDLLKEDDAL